MSEDNLKDDIIPAKLEDGEAIISEELVEKYNQAVEDLKSKKPVATEETVEEDVISTTILSKPEPPKKPSLETAKNGAISSPGANRKDKAASKTVKEVEKVAIYSTRNVTWSGVGKVYRGYNIVTQDQAEQWLKRDHTRLATPEEVAKEFNN